MPKKKEIFAKIDIKSSDLTDEQLVDELRRITDMIEQGYTSGEIIPESGRGWWTLERDEA